MKDERGLAESMSQKLWRAGHAHAGADVVPSLVNFRGVDEAVLSPFCKWLARTGAPLAAILIPAASFCPLLPQQRCRQVD